MGLFGNVGGLLGQLGGMGDAFAQAGAMMSGDWGDAANIAQNRSQLQPNPLLPRLQGRNLQLHRLFSMRRLLD